MNDRKRKNENTDPPSKRACTYKNAFTPLVVPKDKIRAFDSGFMASLKTYDHQKQYVERFFAKILSPKTAFVYAYLATARNEHDETVERHVVEMRTESDVKTLLRHIPNVENGEPFTNAWFPDPKIRAYNRVDFVPYSGVYKDPQNADFFNLFRGFNPVLKTPLPHGTDRTKILKPFMDLCTELFEGREDIRDHVLRYPALKVKHPERCSPGHFIVIHGAQGTGKTTFWKVFERLIGEDYVSCSADPSVFFDTHNTEGYKHKLISIFDNADLKSMKNACKRLKNAAVSDTHLTIMGALSNDKTPLQISYAEKEQNVLVFRTTDKYLAPEYDDEFWNKFNEHVRSPLFLRCLYDYCMEIDFDHINWKTEREKFLTQTYWDLYKA